MKWMFANKPEMAKEWANKTDMNQLPNKVMPSKVRRHLKKNGLSI